ncbi:DUF296 domain-containing protein [Aquabacter sp. L1I39]|uniref:PCC domain-containing protein n=1 Tax=Aquabacter sp. L1I39 TaxID=2820278 RepID=UPI001AD9990A|nr:DUF296 domain-containing protein [Aquabacter sp. L1I39]QTL04679.1 DUF296 domain-containing protein [Aquabacter sp. L1I39]
MSLPSRHMVHPGPVAEERMPSFGGRMERLDLMLEPGLTFCEAIARPLVAAGITAAGLNLSGVALAPFRYVRPSFSPDAEHVAFYSETFEAPAGTRIKAARTTFGYRDGKPFVHCHAIWEEGGVQKGGHLLPFEAVIAEPGQAIAYGCREVAMVALPDTETNFTLFGPTAAEGVHQPDGDCIIARVRPNEDLVGAIEALCRRHGVAEGLVRSGVGSIIGVQFEDGRTISEHPTEILIVDGTITPDAAGQPRAEIAIELIDTRGDVHTGQLARGQNPVLICLELVLERTSSGTAR